MKVIHILGIIVIAIAIGMLVTTAGDVSKYVDFKEAFEMASQGNQSQIHVIGKLKKDAKGKIIGMRYNPVEDPNYFSFVLMDNNNEEKTVIFNSPKPADFDRAEQIVIVGSVKNNQFIANKILMKCPSKYQEGKLETKEATTKL